MGPIFYALLEAPLELFAYEPLLTTDGVRPVPGAVVGFYADTDTGFKAPLEVFTLEGKSLGFSPVADKNGYINNAGGYMLPVQYGKSKSGKLPAVPVFSVRSVIEDAKGAVTAAAESRDAAVNASAKADQIPALVTQATASNSTVVQAAAAAVDANPKIATFDAALVSAGVALDLIANGAFRNGLTDWGATAGWNAEGNGVTSWARAATGAAGLLTQTITVPTYALGRSLRLKVLVNTTSTGTYRNRITTTAGATDVSHVLAPNSWSEKVVDIPVPTNQGTTPITVQVGRTAGVVYMTSVRLEIL